METQKLGQMKGAIAPIVKNQAVANYDDNKFVEIGQAFAQGMQLPQNYDVVSAVKTLYLQCVDLKDKDKRPAFEVCTKESIEKSIRGMISKGLSPLKNQCYPVVYGNQLVIMDSYQGKKRVAYNNGDVIKGSIRSQAIYKNDKFIDKLLNDGRRIIIKHEQAPFGERSDEIIGAYATFQKRVGERFVMDMELMTIKEIQASWAMSKTSGDTHKKFPHEMCCKTVEARACKKLYSWTDENVRVYEATGSIDIANEYGIIDNEKISDIKDNDIDFDNESTSFEEEINVVEETENEVTEVEVAEKTEPTAENDVIIISTKEYTDNKEKYERVMREDIKNGFNDKGYNAETKMMFVVLKND